MKKYGADLCVPDGGIGGHIVVETGRFKWIPVRFLFIGRGVSDIVVSINAIESYGINGSFLYLNIAGYSDTLCFYTFKAKSIVESLKAQNPHLRMFE